MEDLVFFAVMLLSLPFAASSQCSTSVIFNGENKMFSSCYNLGVQEASIAWNLDSSNDTLEVLFSGVPSTSGGWVGWGINPGSTPQMVGTQAFIAFPASNGTTVLTYNVTAATKADTPLSCTPISLHVLDMQVQITNTSTVMLVTLQLSRNQITTLNHVWNRGPAVSNFQPPKHGSTLEDLSGLLQIDMFSGVSTSTISPPNLLLKNRHGVLNTVGWGIMLPTGVMAARYLKPFTDPTWFYVHVFVQLTGYIIGVAGWATGMKLGADSVGIVHRTHRSVGIAVVTIATLQVTAILLRPKKDHKVRKAWNWYHYSLGVTILVMGIVNIFYGFGILQPQGKWMRAYIGVLVGLAIVAAMLEITIWCHVITSRRRRRYSQEMEPQGATVGGAHSFRNGETISDKP